MRQKSMANPVLLSVVLGLAFIAWGCGDDSTPSGPVAPVEQQVQEGAAQLGDFVDSASNTPGAQLLDSPEFQEILGALGAPAVAFSLPSPPGASPTVRRFLGKLGGGPRRTAQTDFGTYDRDPENVQGPFPGWTLVDPNNPPDGFVFRFDFDDGLVVYDDMGMPMPVRGEFRFVNIEIDDGGTPQDPSDDFPSALVLEIAATTATQGVLPVLVRLGIEATFAGTGEPTSLVLGDPLANDPNDAGAAFIGPILLALRIEMGLTTTDALIQVYDSVEDFVVRLDLSETNDPESGMIQAENLELGWGATRHPSSPPWVLAFDLDNFRIVDPVNGGEIADVSGGIAHRGLTLATFNGDTSEVPVDLDGDEIPDLYCINVTVIFVDAPEEPRSFCEALPMIQDLLGNGAVPKLEPLGGGGR